jgi:hypothetical protein
MRKLVDGRYYNQLLQLRGIKNQSSVIEENSELVQVLMLILAPSRLPSVCKCYSKKPSNLFITIRLKHPISLHPLTWDL